MPVTAQRRAAIDATFAKFVPLAMGRRNPAAARDYVTANLSVTGDRSPTGVGHDSGAAVRGQATVRRLEADLLLPEGHVGRAHLAAEAPEDPVTSFSVNLKLVEGKWLVDGIYQLGTHGGVAAPKPKPSAPVTTSQEVSDVDNGLKGRLGFVWILVPLCLLSLIVIIPLVVFTHRVVERPARDAAPPQRAVEGAASAPAAGRFRPQVDRAGSGFADRVALSLA